MLGLPAANLKNYWTLTNLIRDAGIKLSACQASTVKHAVAKSLTTSRTLWRVAAGMGKSHMMMFAALLLLTQRPSAKVYMLYPNADLLEKDAKLLDILKQIS